MQNRNIEERLQILNDYIQRTIDALNATRQVAVQTLGSPYGVQQGLSHSPYMPWQPQFIQTPQGLLPVNPYFSPVQQMGQIGQNFGYGQTYGHGLQHSGFVPGFVPNVMQNLAPQFGYGMQQHLPQFVPNFGYGLQHSTFVPQWSNVTPWTNVPVGYGPYGHSTIGQVQGMGQTQPQTHLGLNQTQI